eukprot:5894311-Ditylum_brightwellii.AAC.1
MIEEKFGLAEKSLTAQFGRRSGAVVLTGAGISMPNLKHAGRWASTLAVEEYMEHSHASNKECLILLDTKRKQHQKRKQTVLRGAVPIKQQKWTIILYAVTTAIAISATMTLIT